MTVPENCNYGHLRCGLCAVYNCVAVINAVSYKVELCTSVFGSFYTNTFEDTNRGVSSRVKYNFHKIDLRRTV